MGRSCRGRVVADPLYSCRASKAFHHNLHGLGVVVDQNEPPPELETAFPHRTATCKKVQYHLTGTGGGPHDAVDHTQRLLGWITGLFATVGGNDGVPPGVGRQLAPRGFLGSNQAGRHIGLAVDVIGVEGVMLRVFSVPKDVIVLGRPFLARASAVIVSPDDLIQERVATKDLVEQKLAVMHLAVIDVEIKTGVWLEDAVSLHQPRLEEGQVVVENVGISFRAELDRLVAPPLEAGAIAGCRIGERADLASADLSAALDLSGVERRVDVNKIDRFRSEHLEDGQVVAEIDRMLGHGTVL